MPEVVLDEIVKSYGNVRATDGVNLTIADGEFVTLLGPSGCGKTTLLRSIAGLERIDGGHIALNDRIVVDPKNHVFVPPEKRDLGMVFQSYALWPHMSVEGNISYPLRTRRRGTRAEIKARVNELMNVVGLSGMQGRLISELSGGQQQRVALARALAAGSELVLYDEPLSNLDAGMRVSMRDEIRKVHDAMGTTSVFVTHDQEEALALSDRVVLMNRGQIVQVGTPHEVYAAPRDAFVAEFLGFENIFGLERAHSNGEQILRAQPGGFVLPASQYPRITEDHVGFAVKASHIRLASSVRVDEAPIFSATVRSRTYIGDRTQYVLDLESVEVHALVLNHLVDESSLPQEGEQVPVQFPPSLVAPLSDETHTS